MDHSEILPLFVSFWYNGMMISAVLCLSFFSFFVPLLFILKIVHDLESNCKNVGSILWCNNLHGSSFNCFSVFILLIFLLFFLLFYLQEWHYCALRTMNDVAVTIRWCWALDGLLLFFELMVSQPKFAFGHVSLTK